MDNSRFTQSPEPPARQPAALRGTKYRDWDDLRNDLDAEWPEWETEGGYKSMVEAARDLDLLPQKDKWEGPWGHTTSSIAELDFSDSASWARLSTKDY